MITLHNTLSMTSSQLCQVLGDRTVTAQVIKYQTLKYLTPQLDYFAKKLIVTINVMVKIGLLLIIVIHT